MSATAARGVLTKIEPAVAVPQEHDGTTSAHEVGPDSSVGANLGVISVCLG